MYRPTSTAIARRAIAAACSTLVLSIGCSGLSVFDTEDAETQENPGADLPSRRCDADGPSSDAALHAAALEALTSTRADALGPCAFSGCHGTEGSHAKLALSLGTLDLREALVGLSSCQMPDLPLVDGSGGEQALDRSWLWQKLTAPADERGALLRRADWSEPARCEQGVDAPYGMRMPLSASDAQLSGARLEALRRWICAGAPGL